MLHRVQHIRLLCPIATMKSFLSLVGLVVLFSSLFWFDGFVSDSRNDLINNGERTIGTIEAPGSNIITSYKVGDKLIRTKKRSQPFSGLQNEEMYHVAFDPEDHTEYVVIYQMPFIGDSSKYGRTAATVIEHSWLSESRIKFKYVVNNKLYTRYQKVFNRTLYPETSHLTVLYQLENPRIAYLEK